MGSYPPQGYPVVGPATSIASGDAFPAAPVEGDCFYRTDLDEFYVYDGAAWVQWEIETHASEHEPGGADEVNDIDIAGTGVNVSAHAARHLAAAADDLETSLRLAQLSEKAHGSLTGVTPDQHHPQIHAATHASGGTDEIANLWDKLVPSGAIVMWHGLLADIPAGWVLCDGTSGTPDLREKFVRGTPAATNPGGTGGADSKSTSGVGDHTHDIPVKNIYTAGTAGGASEIETGPAGAHAHTVDVRPSYYEVAFIMKS